MNSSRNPKEEISFLTQNQMEIMESRVTSGMRGVRLRQLGDETATPITKIIGVNALGEDVLDYMGAVTDHVNTHTRGGPDVTEDFLDFVLGIIP
jgi:hypothetical protein